MTTATYTLRTDAAFKGTPAFDENPPADRWGGAEGMSFKVVADGIDWLRRTVELLQVPPLGELGLARADHGRVADAALVASSMAGNPVRLTRDEVLEILDRSS